MGRGDFREGPHHDVLRNNLLQTAADERKMHANNGHFTTCRAQQDRKRGDLGDTKKIERQKLYGELQSALSK